MVEEFLVSINAKLEDVKIFYNHKTRSYEIKDRKILHAWQDYHADNVKLRWISKKGNKEQAAKHRKTKRPNVLEPKKQKKGKKEEEEDIVDLTKKS